MRSLLTFLSITIGVILLLLSVYILYSSSANSRYSYLSAAICGFLSALFIIIPIFSMVIRMKK